MRSVNFFLNVVLPLAQKMGMSVTTDLLSDVSFAYGTFINIAVLKLYDRFDWPDYVNIEERTPDTNHYIDFQQGDVTPGLADIHRILKVYQRDPRITFPRFDIPFRLDSNGVHVGYDHGASVWIKYMPPAPEYTTLQWSSTINYGIGFLAYDPSVGSTYSSLQSPNLNNNPSATEGVWWSKVLFSEALSDLVVRIAFAEALREDGQFDKAQAEEAAVIQEAITKVAAMVNQPFDTIGDQSRAASRYRPPATVIFSGGAGGGAK